MHTQRNIRWILLVCIVFVSIRFSGACTCNSSSPTLSIGTFNTYEDPFAPATTTRLSAMISYFNTNSSKFDALCLQELWDPSTRDTFISGVSANFPYSYFPPRFTSGTCTKACNSSEIILFEKCINSSGCLVSPAAPITSNINTTACIASACSAQFGALSSSCQSCIGLISSVPINTSLVDCLNVNGTEVNSVDCVYLFGGYSDTLILSKTPFVYTDYLLYSNSPMTADTALLAKISLTNFGIIDLFCTHLAPPRFPYPLPSFDAANANETQELLSFINRNTDAGEFVVVAGDFNSGPTVGTNLAIRTSSYNDITSAGFEDVLVTLDASATPCTICSSNPLVAPTEPNEEIDHIFLSNSSSPSYCITHASTFATHDYVTINGKASPLSDHYGVTASFCKSTLVIPVVTTAPPPVVTTTESIIIFQVSTTSEASQKSAYGLYASIIGYLFLLFH